MNRVAVVLLKLKSGAVVLLKLKSGNFIPANYLVNYVCIGSAIFQIKTYFNIKIVLM